MSCAELNVGSKIQKCILKKKISAKNKKNEKTRKKLDNMDFKRSRHQTEQRKRVLDRHVRQIRKLEFSKRHALQMLHDPFKELDPQGS